MTNCLKDICSDNDDTITVAIDLAALCRHMAEQEILIRELRMEIANLHFAQPNPEPNSGDEA